MTVRAFLLLALALTGCHRLDLDARTLCERAIRDGSDAPDLVELLATERSGPNRIIVTYRPYYGRPGPIVTATCSLIPDEHGGWTGWMAEDRGVRNS
jgi:hypothetical protein